MSFSYRLRVRANSGLTTDQDSVQLTIPGLQKPVEVKAAKGTLSAPVWLVYCACGFPTREAAYDEGKKLQRALMLAGPRAGCGMDVGDNKSGRQYSDYLKSAIRARGLGELRDNVHGLDAFAEGDDVFYCENDMRGSSSYSVDSWKEHISLCLSLIRGVSDRHQNAASLINDSAFNPNPDVQFLLRITAVEALCEQAKASDPLIAFIRTVARTAEESDLNEGDRKEIVDTMNRAKKQSVGSAIRSKITALLGQETAAHFFKLYRHRSKFVHQGKHRGELGQYADDARRIAVDLLFADVEQNISHAASIEVSL